MPYAVFIGWSVLLTAVSWVRPRCAPYCGFVLLVSAILFAGFRGDSADYAEYVMRYKAMESSGLPLLVRLYIGKDPWFGGVILALQSVGLRVQALFLVSAALALGLKARAFARFFGSYVTPLLVTICTTYFLHEYTQIRVAIAVGLAFVGLVALCEGRRGVWALCSLLSVGFHISAVAVIMCELPFLVALERPLWLAAWGCSCLAVMVAMSSLLTLVSNIISRVETYVSGESVTAHAIIVVCFKLAAVSLLAYLVLCGELPPEKRRLIKACYFMEIMGCGIFFITARNAPGLGFRVMELLDGFSVFIIAAAFMWSSALSWAVAFSYCTSTIILVAVSDLMVPYRFATNPFW